MEPARFLAARSLPAQSADPKALWDAVERLAAAGYTGVEIALPWAELQPADAQALDFTRADRLVAALRARRLEVRLLVDYRETPSWFDAEECGMRDGRGKIVAVFPGNHALPAINARRVCDQVAGLFKACAGHFREAVAYHVDPGLYVWEAGHHATGPQLDVSRWASEAFRLWVRAQYMDISLLNAAWNSSFKAWDEVVAGEGVRKASQADFHLFRYATLASWTEHMKKASGEGAPQAKYAFRTGGRKAESNLEQLGFDPGRCARRCDALVARDFSDPWQANLVRTAAELYGCEWVIEVSPKETWGGDDDELAAKDASAWMKMICGMAGTVCVRSPGGDAACRSLEKEMAMIVKGAPGQPRNNRQAIYVSAAEAQFWDGTDLEAARMRWLDMTEAGKKPKIDVLTDGMFSGNPQVLKRYTAGIEIPFARTLARETRTALIQAAAMGIRLKAYDPAQAGTQDEHGKAQAPLIARKE